MQYDFQTILLDLDGTVTDSGEGIMNSAAYALRHFGITEPSREQLRAFVGPPLQESFREFWGFDEQETARAVTFYREYYTKQGMFENRPYPGIENLLKALGAAGKRVVLATSKAEVFARTILDHFGLTDYFDLICGCELDGTRSAKSEVIAYALEKADVFDRSKSVMVGDRKFDIIGAKENGLFAIGAAYGYPEEGELKAAGADVVVGSVAELKAFLLGANRL